MSNKKDKKTNKGLVKKDNSVMYFTYKDALVPPNLKVNPFFATILSMDADKLFAFNIEALASFGYKDIDSFFHPEEGYIFAKGTIPVCLCAHMDKVPHYESIKKINRYCIVDKKQRIVDTILSSKQGIGGDDRCGVYAILSMLKLGYRPSVLFCMGEEIGCRGSRKFTTTHDKDFLSDINAFIQIDRRGSHDVVRYSDSNDELTKAIEKFDFKHAYGSCTDISVLMPHFGISGVNLSSGYYNEHSASREYVSVKDVNYLLKRLAKILSSDIFNKKYEYKAYVYHSFDYGSYSRLTGTRSYQQLALFDADEYLDDNYGVCDCCGEYCEQHQLVEIDSPFYDFVCPDCEESFLKQGYVKCSSCKNLFYRETTNRDPKFAHDFCPYCGTLLEDEQ